jgi:uncharacterized protein (DUF885 family)
VVLVLFASAMSAQSSATSFGQFLKQAYEDRLKDSPDLADGSDQWPDLSPESRARRNARWRQWRSSLKGFDRGQLSGTDQLYYDLFSYGIERRVEAALYPDELLAIAPVGRGPHHFVSARLGFQMPRTIQDYEKLLNLLRTVPRYLDQNMALLREGVREGITQPSIILQDVPAQIEKLIAGAPQSSPFLAAFQRFPTSISEVERQRLTEQAVALIDGGVLPAFRRFREYLINDYIPHARTTIARSALRNGSAWYAFNVRDLTTTTLSPREIHELGLREVARIRAQMDTIRKETGFHGDHVQFLEFLRTAPQFYFTKPEDLLISFRDLCKRIDPELPRLFRTLPRTPYGVIAMPENTAMSGAAASYRSSADGSQPGYFQVNTSRVSSRPKYEMEALALHEAVPGHHLQGALSGERPEAPRILRSFGAYAFVEGWGLYAESLGTELGLYRDPYSRFGALNLEIMRAARLVVDTGMHALGWSRQQAVEYMGDNTALSEQNILVEVDRYIAQPGQALTYKVGELTIKQLRSRAEKKLGDRFDVREFHDAVLRNGALPLDVLEEQIESYVGNKK